MRFKTQQRKSHNYITLSLHLLMLSLFLKITHQETTNLHIWKVKKDPIFLKNLLRGLLLFLFNKVRQPQKIPRRKSCTFWRLCEKHMDLCQKRSEFWNQINSSLGNRPGARHLSDRSSAFSHHTHSHLSSHLTWMHSHTIHVYPLSSSCPSPTCLHLTSCLPPKQTVKNKKHENTWKEFRNNEKLQVSPGKWGNSITDFREDGGNQNGDDWP